MSLTGIQGIRRQTSQSCPSQLDAAAEAPAVAFVAGPHAVAFAEAPAGEPRAEGFVGPGVAEASVEERDVAVGRGAEDQLVAERGAEDRRVAEDELAGAEAVVVWPEIWAEPAAVWEGRTSDLGP
ncbi:hypothetical protein IWW37_004828 [Coemansia sp. RSA 2050]|nr:hypothetical protein IWW37_004828 [Coemansia sp. RSA 2050]